MLIEETVNRLTKLLKVVPLSEHEQFIKKLNEVAHEADELEAEVCQLKQQNQNLQEALKQHGEEAAELVTANHLYADMHRTCLNTMGLSQDVDLVQAFKTVCLERNNNAKFLTAAEKANIDKDIRLERAWLWFYLSLIGLGLSAAFNAYFMLQ